MILSLSLILALIYVICGFGVIRMCRNILLNRVTGNQLDDSNLDQFIAIMVWPFLVFVIGLFYLIDKIRRN